MFKAIVGINATPNKEGLHPVVITGPPLSVDVTEQYINLASTVEVGYMDLFRTRRSGAVQSRFLEKFV
jgi:hypothetical protein